MRWYIDASVALHALLPSGDLRARDWLDSAIEAGDEVFSSTLLHLELTRVLRREGLDVSMARAVLDRINLASIDDAILRFAAAIKSHIKSLDAIHLASCALLGSRICVVTQLANYDCQVMPGTVSILEQEGQAFVAKIGATSVLASKILLATGVVDRIPAIPGLQQIPSTQMRLVSHLRRLRIQRPILGIACAGPVGRGSR